MRALRFLAVLMVLLPLGAQAARMDSLSIVSSDGKTHVFQIELALTVEEQRRGLMYRQSLPAGQGMLFDYVAERQIDMWMKNTLIPLDMLFIGKDGTIRGIAERAVPYSLEDIASPGPVRAVLEINGGTVDRLHIHTGDKVSYRLFGP